MNFHCHLAYKAAHDSLSFGCVYRLVCTVFCFIKRKSTVCPMVKRGRCVCYVQKSWLGKLHENRENHSKSSRSASPAKFCFSHFIWFTKNIFIKKCSVKLSLKFFLFFWLCHISCKPGKRKKNSQTTARIGVFPIVNVLKHGPINLEENENWHWESINIQSAKCIKVEFQQRESTLFLQ